MTDNDNQQPSIPSMGDGTRGGARPGAGRPTAKKLDERSAGLDMRESELADREAALDARDTATQTPVEDTPPRISINENAVKHGKGENTKAIGTSTMRIGRKFPDPTPYLQKYPDKKFMWMNDVNGDVQRWIDVGAEPVPILINKRRQFEGLTDKTESQWVRVVGGSYEGHMFYVYMLMMDPEIHEMHKAGPARERQEAIKRSMRQGEDKSDSGSGLQSYAPNLPTGGRGYETTREVAG